MPVDIYVAGEPMIALTDLGQSAFMARRIPLVFLVISLMLLISFRNLQGMFIPMLTAVLSTVWALGLDGPHRHRDRQLERRRCRYC